jgi:gluconolactonase
LVSDDTVGEDTIYEVSWDGAVSPWVDQVPTPNGMVFSLDGAFLYVATTFEQTGLWRVPVSEQGEAGAPERWVEFEGSTAPDGVAIDSEGNVYVALNTAGQIAKVDEEGNASTLATGLFGPASLAFGQGDFDPCSMYVTSLFGTQMSRVGVGVPGVEK